MPDSILSITDSTQSTLDSSQVSLIANEAKAVLERRPRDAAPTESKAILDLIEKIKRVAPHMENSSVLNTVWWEDNKHKLGIQVSFVVKLRGQRLRHYACRCSSASSCNQLTTQHMYSTAPILGSRISL